MAPKRGPRRTDHRTTDTTTPMSSEAIEQLVAQRVADAIAQYDAGRPSGSGGDRESNGGTEEPVRGCSYKAFLNCKPLNFRGNEGAVGLMRWIEKMESVQRISNCVEENKTKYATCTFEGQALSWWNTHAQTIGIDAAYQIPWDELKKMLSDKYCPRNELQKLEVEF